MYIKTWQLKVRLKFQRLWCVFVENTPSSWKVFLEIGNLLVQHFLLSYLIFKTGKYSVLVTIRLQDKWQSGCFVVHTCLWVKKNRFSSPDLLQRIRSAIPKKVFYVFSLLKARELSWLFSAFSYDTSEYNIEKKRMLWFVRVNKFSYLIVCFVAEALKWGKLLNLHFLLLFLWESIRQ